MGHLHPFFAESAFVADLEREQLRQFDGWWTVERFTMP
jgi:hypothetical protein